MLLSFDGITIQYLRIIELCYLKTKIFDTALLLFDRINIKFPYLNLNSSAAYYCYLLYCDNDLANLLLFAEQFIR